MFGHHYSESVSIHSSPENVFAFLDDHTRLSKHMNRSSWMMGGGRMKTAVDEGRGQRIGSHITLTGKAFGIKIFLDEVITQYDPPRFKAWETVGSPKLLVVGSYRMGVEIMPQNATSLLKIFIDYDLPEKNPWLGRLFGGYYAKWCVRQMLDGVRGHLA